MLLLSSTRRVKITDLVYVLPELLSTTSTSPVMVSELVGETDGDMV